MTQSWSKWLHHVTSRTPMWCPRRHVVQRGPQVEHSELCLLCGSTTSALQASRLRSRQGRHVPIAASSCSIFVLGECTHPLHRCGLWVVGLSVGAPCRYTRQLPRTCLQRVGGNTPGRVAFPASVHAGPYTTRTACTHRLQAPHAPGPCSVRHTYLILQHFLSAAW